jgi:hypothetical protein
MRTVTSFNASAVGKAELTGIMAEYLALEQVRVVRRLLVTRCGAMALVAVGLGLVHWLSPFASGFSVTAFLSLPVSAWVFELRRNARLGRRLAEVPGAVSEEIVESGVVS